VVCGPRARPSHAGRRICRPESDVAVAEGDSKLLASVSSPP
jgi:hypothetical protein